MRDPDLMQRAEQAATALEEAWMRWRVRQGLNTGPLPPVSSYVGYSVDEPWGQPRVVFGMEANEAEHLAAILDGRDYVVPPRAENNGLSERRQPEIVLPRAESNGLSELSPRAESNGLSNRPPWAESNGLSELSPRAESNGLYERKQPEIAPPRSEGDGLSELPPRAEGDGLSELPLRSEGNGLSERKPPETAPAAWTTPAGNPGVPAQPTGNVDVPAQLPPAATPPWPAVPYRPDWRPRSAQPEPQQEAAPSERGQVEPEPEPVAAPAEDEVDYGRAEELTAEQPILPHALRRAAALADAPAELPDHEAAYLQELAARPGIVALRPRGAQPESAVEPVITAWRSAPYLSQPGVSPAQPAKGFAAKGSAAKGPAQLPAVLSQPEVGSRRKQQVRPGVPEQAAPVAGIPERAPETPSASGMPSAAGESDGDEVQVTRLLPVSRLSRPRKASEPDQRPTPMSGDSATTPTDTAV